MDPKESWEDRPTDILLNKPEKKVFQRAIGQLMYLMLATRLDISYAVTKLAQFGSCPTQRHWNGVLRLLPSLPPEI